MCAEVLTGLISNTTLMVQSSPRSAARAAGGRRVAFRGGGESVCLCGLSQGWVSVGLALDGGGLPNGD